MSEYDFDELEMAAIEEEREGYRPIKGFEDLIAWQKARELTAAIYRITRESELRRDSALSGQMQRAAVSIMSNIAEGHERGTTQEYHRHLTIAKGSAAELRSQLYVALDVGHIDQRAFDELMTAAESVSRIVGALRASIARRLKRQREN